MKLELWNKTDYLYPVTIHDPFLCSMFEEDMRYSLLVLDGQNPLYNHSSISYSASLSARQLFHSSHFYISSCVPVKLPNTESELFVFLLTISYYYSCTPVHAASSLPLRNIINCVCMNRCCVFNAVSLLSWCWYLCFCFMTVLLCTERYFGCDETLFCSPLTSGLQYSFCNRYNFSLPLDSPQPLSIWWLWSLHFRKIGSHSIHQIFLLFLLKSVRMLVEWE